MDDQHIDAILDAARPVPLWLDTGDGLAPRSSLSGGHRASLVVVGGGFTGLWTALRAKERQPDRDVLLLEGGRIGDAASGRNGGFCEASLTHGEHNGMARWPDEFAELERLGRKNLAELIETVERYGIDCRLESTGMLRVATRPHQVEGLEPGTPGFLDRNDVRALVDSPTYLAGRVTTGDCVLIDPARLVRGLAEAAEGLGVRIAENTPVTGIGERGSTLRVETSKGQVVDDKVVLATNAFRPLLRRLRLSTVPVYDYVLATEPLTPAQLKAVGWSGRQGVSDSGNQFHYYRLTPDNRILWGGYDAIYHYGRRTHPDLEDRRATHHLLARQFYETFPQLQDVRFTHRWGGVVDTCTRFCAFFGTARKNRVAYALGFTGLGVAASRFAADVMLDLLDGEETERTRTAMVRRKPLPFPPEPVAWIGIQITRRSMAAEDRHGRRNLWLRVLDRLGLGFDS
ncbi:FAD-dependent oxidoreductase [Streptomyces sp. NPDC004539]|uniref:NAD(P)/FAD-dependent oxidoreductase n=1 Tax=Streptomyces sp. NPDC004539 TaxID=3154280 RepID=UPI0033A53569